MGSDAATTIAKAQQNAPWARTHHNTSIISVRAHGDRILSVHHACTQVKWCGEEERSRDVEGAAAGEAKNPSSGRRGEVSVHELGFMSRIARFGSRPSGHAQMSDTRNAGLQATHFQALATTRKPVATTSTVSLEDRIRARESSASKVNGAAYANTLCGRA